MKKRTLSEAMKRYQDELDHKRRLNEQHIASHFNQIKNDQTYYQQQVDLRKKKQEMLQRDLTHQIAIAVSGQALNVLGGQAAAGAGKRKAALEDQLRSRGPRRDPDQG